MMESHGGNPSLPPCGGEAAMVLRFPSRQAAEDDLRREGLRLEASRPSRPCTLHPQGGGSPARRRISRSPHEAPGRKPPSAWFAREERP